MPPPLTSKVLVHIWKFRASLKRSSFAYGHASMTVCDRRGRSAYISWWPDDNRSADPKIPFAYTAYPEREQTHEWVVKAEGQEADHTLEVVGLDEEKIIDFWSDLSLELEGERRSGPLLPWSAKTLNCSTVVFKALWAGGASKHAKDYWFIDYWTPNRVLDFVQTLRHRLNNPQSKL